MEQLSHPCDLNTEARLEAEVKCSVLRSQTFRGCHSQVSPETAYENCLYDVCSCQRSQSDCLCPVLAHYADLCVERNVRLDWRREVRQCGLHCPAGQEYRQCADSCAHSCADISLDAGPDCSSRCVEGCSCPQGETLSETGDCIPVSSCPCRLRDVLYTAGSRDFRPQSGQVCSCTNARWFCQPATTSQLSEMSSSASPVCEESDHRVLAPCHHGPSLSCSNMHSANLSSTSSTEVETEVCTAQCVCAPGYVEDDQGDCIPFRQCPCHHAGQSYQEGDIIKQRCNTWWALSLIIMLAQLYLLSLVNVWEEAGPAPGRLVLASVPPGARDITRPSMIKCSTSLGTVNTSWPEAR